MQDNDKKKFVNTDHDSHNECKLPKQTYLYFPKDQEIIEYDETQPYNTMRRIFEGGLEYNSFENTKLAEINDEINKQNSDSANSDSPKIIFPSDWKACNTLRFLQARSYHIQNTVETIKEHLLWKLEGIPSTLSDKSMEILNNLGFIYIHGRDNRFRPIIVIVAKVYMDNKDKYSYENWVNALIYILEYTLKNLMIPGQIENWNIISDLADLSVWSIPADFKKIFNTLSCNYRCRLYVMYILNMSTFIVFLWDLIKRMLDPTTEGKLKILKSLDDDCSLFASMNRDQVEKKFGGNAENIVKDYFPPKMPSNQYLTKLDDKSKLLITKREYVNILNKNSELKISPYIDINNLSNDESDKESKYPSPFKPSFRSEDVLIGNHNGNENGKSNVSLKNTEFGSSSKDSKLNKSHNYLEVNHPHLKEEDLNTDISRISKDNDTNKSNIIASYKYLIHSKLLIISN